MLRLFIELPLKTTKLSDKSYWLGSINGSLVEAAVDEVRIVSVDSIERLEAKGDVNSNTLAYFRNPFGSRRIFP